MGTYHVARSAHLLPQYRILYANAKRSDVVILVRNMVAQYATLVSSVGRMGMAFDIELPGQENFEIINVHGPFSKAQRDEFDQWIQTRQKRQVVMGDTSIPVGNARISPNAI